MQVLAQLQEQIDVHESKARSRRALLGEVWQVGPLLLWHSQTAPGSLLPPAPLGERRQLVRFVSVTATEESSSPPQERMLAAR